MIVQFINQGVETEHVVGILKVSGGLMKAKSRVISGLTKGEASRIRILESTALSVAKYGFEGTSVTKICKIGKHPRGLILYYFNGIRNLFLETAAYVVKQGQDAVTGLVNSFLEKHDPVEAYLRAMSQWHLEQPNPSRFILLLYVAASHNKDFEGVTSGLIQQGRHRMKELIEHGRKNKIYQSKESSDELAHSLYNLLSGVFLLTFVEKEFNPKQLQRMIELKNQILEKK